MGRGLIEGTLWGALLGLCAIALASQLATRQELSFPRPEAAALEVPGGSEFDQARPETDPIVPAPEAQTEVDDVPRIGALDGGEAAPQADTAPAVPPAVATDAGPDTVQAPVVPQGGTEISSGDRAPVTATPAAPQVAEPPTPGPEAETAEVVQPRAPEMGEAPQVAAADDGPRIGSPVAPLPGTPQDSLPSATQETPLAPIAGQDAPETPQALAAPEGSASALEGSGLPQPGFASVGTLTDRLPQVGDDSETDEPAEDIAIGIDDAPALVRFAEPFEVPPGTALVSVVLLHPVGTPPGAATGRDLGLPVSFAVRAADPDIAATAGAYRAAGRELVLIPALPPGAAPSDVEVALAANFRDVPEAVALMDDPETGFQSERTAIAQVVNIAADRGQGLVTFQRGLNTAQQLAERAGLPARLIFRELEGSTEDMVRMLDRAAFRARQEGVVVLVGQAVPATIAALRDWEAANITGTVALAPVSAALRAQ